MASGDFHKKPFDEGTITKLQIFELYAREWLPVFLATAKPPRPEIHLFDFFAGPGTDSNGELGSPLRLLRQVKEYQNMPGSRNVQVFAHFFDSSHSKIKQLQDNIDSLQLRLPSVNFDVEPLDFTQAMCRCGNILLDPQAAKLLLIDQFGVGHVTPDVFRVLVKYPTCDFLFFISSSTLHRFREDPAIKQKITRPDDYYQVHQAVVDYYKNLLTTQTDYFIAPFSIKKGSNIYGIIFGSAHPLGMDKFLQVAWKKDEINGEADFDINRDNIVPGQTLLGLDEFRPTKITAFERDLEQLLKNERLNNELDVIRICFNHGVRRQQAEPVLTKLKKNGILTADFRVPQIDRWKSPRPIRLIQ